LLKGTQSLSITPYIYFSFNFIETYLTDATSEFWLEVDFILKLISPTFYKQIFVNLLFAEKHYEQKLQVQKSSAKLV